VAERVLERVLGLEDAGAAQQVPGAVGADIGLAALAPVAGSQVEDVLRGELVEVAAGVQMIDEIRRRPSSMWRPVMPTSAP